MQAPPVSDPPPPGQQCQCCRYRERCPCPHYAAIPPSLRCPFYVRTSSTLAAQWGAGAESGRTAQGDPKRGACDLAAGAST
jgi:hypothetical protein